MTKRWGHIERKRDIVWVIKGDFVGSIRVRVIRINTSYSYSAREAHFLVQFSAVFMHDYNVKLPETFYLHVLWRKCRVCSFLLCFSLLLIFTLVAASISHFLTASNKIFMFFFQQNWLPSGLSLALALALLSASRYTLKFSGKEDSGGGTQIRCCFFFSLPKSQGGHAVYHRNARVLDVKFYPFLTWRGGRTCGRFSQK